MIFKPTHVGQLSGDARTGDHRPVVRLRETVKYWISKDGTKFRKSNGWPTGDDSYPLWTLSLETVKPIGAGSPTTETA